MLNQSFSNRQRFAGNSEQIIEEIIKDRRSSDNMRRIIENADIEYEHRVNGDRRMHSAECMAGFCCCSEVAE